MPGEPGFAKVIVDNGVAIALIIIASPLLFVYFWRLIQQKTIWERCFESQTEMLKQLILKIDKVKDDVLVIRSKFGGDFRIKGRDDE